MNNNKVKTYGVNETLAYWSAAAGIDARCWPITENSAPIGASQTIDAYCHTLLSTGPTVVLLPLSLDKEYAHKLKGAEVAAALRIDHGYRGHVVLAGYYGRPLVHRWMRDQGLALVGEVPAEDAPGMSYFCAPWSNDELTAALTRKPELTAVQLAATSQRHCGLSQRLARLAHSFNNWCSSLQCGPAEPDATTNAVPLSGLPMQTISELGRLAGIAGDADLQTRLNELHTSAITWPKIREFARQLQAGIEQLTASQGDSFALLELDAMPGPPELPPPGWDSVVLMDDQPDALRELERAMRRRKYNVEVTSDYSQALYWTEDLPFPATIVCDMGWKGIDNGGYELLRHAVAQRDSGGAALLVVALTASPKKPEIPGVTDYLWGMHGKSMRGAEYLHRMIWRQSQAMRRNIAMGEAGDG